MADDHATLPVALPSLDHLTNEELGALRGKVMTVMREARRKSTQVIGRAPSLKKSWSKSLTITKDTAPEARIAILTEFEQELLRVPEAYLAHAYANSLTRFDELLRETLARRSTGSVNPRKKASTPAPVVAKIEEPPSAPPPPPEPPPTQPALEGADALAAMFDAAVDDDAV